MPDKASAVIVKLFQKRDELSFRNIRGGLWSALFVFPLSVVMGNLRYFDHSIALAGFAANELMFFLLGLGWLILTLTPKRFILPLLRLAAVISVILLIIQIFMPMGFGRFTLYMAFKFCNGLSAACAFYLFCFVLNNIERLFGMALIQLYYGFYYFTLSAFPAFHTSLNSWGGVATAAVFLVVVFSCQTKFEINTGNDGKGSGVPFVIGLGVVHYMIMCMSNYIEWAENSVSGLAFGLGIFISIGIVLIIQLLKGRSALYIWLLFLVLSLLGLGALLYDTPVSIISGSFAYGLGDSLGYIIICYMCFNYLDSPNKTLAFGVVLVLVSLCFLFMPLIQKRLFEADWTDGLYLRDMEEYSRSLAETSALNAKEHLELTPREQEIFTMLLNGSAPKEIAHTLKISYDTVLFHQKNLYRKLGIQSRSELFARYSNKTAEKNIQ